MIELTAHGQQQALSAGLRIQEIAQRGSIMMFTSPYVRTVQTARAVFSVVEDQVSGNHIEPRIREQEFGNLQDETFSSLRTAQNQVGRFWYRFPTGESGADVYDRVKQWWYEAVLRVNMRPGQPDVETVLVTTHGLTMRLILMQLQGWSPNTFHTGALDRPWRPDRYCSLVEIVCYTRPTEAQLELYYLVNSPVSACFPACLRACPCLPLSDVAVRLLLRSLPRAVWNAGNCEMYVLNLDLELPGFSPYALSKTGHCPPASGSHTHTHTE